MLAQFAGTSLWFAGNAVIDELPGISSVAAVTISIQLGFIAGTLLFAILSLADRYSPVKLFFTSSVLASVFNLLIIWFADSNMAIMCLRFLTGFFLAGIYPVGMKIAADWHKEGLGKALGWLVGALVFGTALPHLFRAEMVKLPWENVFLITSLIALIGGVMIRLWVPDGPYRKQSTSFDIRKAFTHFGSRKFRLAAVGYFGHMWELYTFWAFMPSFVNQSFGIGGYASPFFYFAVIAIGGIGCIAGGYIALKHGNANVAYWSLIISFLCCIAAYFVTVYMSELAVPFYLLWGLTVVSDSPQFSTLVARNAIAEQSGSALTLVTSIGFAITIVSIQVIELLFETQLHPMIVFSILALGPLIGILAIRKLREGH